jgi:tetratricopeptide (TPR) repeat protein
VATVNHDNWYRNACWSEDIEIEFFRRLRRARDKLQPLRIQASLLTESRADIALRILEKYFADAGGDHFDRAQALVDGAQAHITLGNADAAVESLEAALVQEEARPTAFTLSYLELPMLIVRNRMSDQYERAIEVLKQHSDRPQFPIHKYQWYCVLALLLNEQGKSSEAQLAAKKALGITMLQQSGFRNHQSLGLVPRAEDDLRKRVQQIANKLR